MVLTDKDDFGDSCHMASTEPFFYDSTILCCDASPIGIYWQRILFLTILYASISDEIPRYSAKEPPMKWECSSECKILSDIVFAGGAWIFKKMNKEIGMLLP